MAFRVCWVTSADKMVQRVVQNHQLRGNAFTWREYFGGWISGITVSHRFVQDLQRQQLYEILIMFRDSENLKLQILGNLMTCKIPSKRLKKLYNGANASSEQLNSAKFKDSRPDLQQILPAQVHLHTRQIAGKSLHLISRDRVWANPIYTRVTLKAPSYTYSG